MLVSREEVRSVHTGTQMAFCSGYNETLLDDTVFCVMVFHFVIVAPIRQQTCIFVLIFYNTLFINIGHFLTSFLE